MQAITAANYLEELIRLAALYVSLEPDVCWCLLYWVKYQKLFWSKR
jgi:hypothetical protein